MTGRTESLGHPVNNALLAAFSATHGPEALRPDQPGYTVRPSANLVGRLGEDVLHDFADGSGGELTGPLPKFCALHSSSALAANSFGPMRLHPEHFELAGMSRFSECRFERKLPTGLLGTPPNLDFFARGEEGIVAVESKFTETLSRKSANFAPSYEEAVQRLAEAGGASMYETLRAEPRRYRHLDAAQLVKHYLGMRHSLRLETGKLVLLYVYWEPMNAEGVRAFSEHREEVRDFAVRVGSSRIRFVACTHGQLWDHWETNSTWPGAREHVRSLRDRYEVTV